MSQWVRLWEDMPTDPKWRIVAKRSGRPVSEIIAVFTMMMLNAGAAEPRGSLSSWEDDEAAVTLDMEPEHVAAIREAMQGKTLDGNHLTGWDRRQPKREDLSTDRVKAFRERQADLKRDETQRNADGTPVNARQKNETQRNAPEEKREDTEKNIQPSFSRPRASARTALDAKPEEKDELTDCFEEILSVYPHSNTHSHTKALDALRAIHQVEWPRVVAGARAYSAEYKAAPTKWPVSLDGFIAERRWANYGAKPTGPPKVFVPKDDPRYAVCCAATGHKQSLTFTRDIDGCKVEGWEFPPEVLTA